MIHTNWTLGVVRRRPTVAMDPQTAAEVLRGILELADNLRYSDQDEGCYARVRRKLDQRVLSIQLRGPAIAEYHSVIDDLHEVLAWVEAQRCPS